MGFIAELTDNLRGDTQAAAACFHSAKASRPEGNRMAGPEVQRDPFNLKAGSPAFYRTYRCVN